MAHVTAMCGHPSALDIQADDFDSNSHSSSYRVKRFSVIMTLRFLICRMEMKMSHMVSGNFEMRLYIQRYFESSTAI